MTEPERPAPTYATRPATAPRVNTGTNGPYPTVSTQTTQSTPLTTNQWPVPKRGMGVIGGVLLLPGSLLVLGAGAASFSATSLFVCIWFTGWMVVGAVMVVGAGVIAALR